MKTMVKIKRYLIDDITDIRFSLNKLSLWMPVIKHDNSFNTALENDLREINLVLKNYVEEIEEKKKELLNIKK